MKQDIKVPRKPTEVRVVRVKATSDGQVEGVYLSNGTVLAGCVGFQVKQNAAQNQKTGELVSVAMITVAGKIDLDMPKVTAPPPSALIGLDGKPFRPGAA